MLHWLILLLLNQCSKLTEDQRLQPITNACDLKKLSEPPPECQQPDPEPPPPKRQRIIFDEALQKPVSIDLQDDTDIRPILREVGKSIGVTVNFLIPETKGLHYSAHDKPFLQILDDVCDALNLRFSITGTMVKIEADKPFFKNYAVHFLKFARDADNRVSSMTDAFKDKEHKGDDSGQENGSNSSVHVKSSIDFWSELETALKVMLADSQFSIHRQGGIISVMGNTRQHKMVEEYLKHLERVISAQVLIEAKVIEVTLTQEFQSGIDWSLMDKKAGDTQTDGFKLDAQSFDANSASIFTMGARADIFSVFLKSMEKFGSLRVVSSPRITVLNNQTAVIKVAENEVFFKVNYQTSFLGLVAQAKDNPNLGNGFQTLSTSEIRTKPVGFIMPIQVSINRDTGEVILFVRPTVSRLKKTVSDPAVDFNARANGIKDNIMESKIPVVEVREIDSVIRLKSGNVAVLGGLMETRSKDDRKGPAGSERYKPLKYLAGGQASSDRLIELVILLKATIMGDRPMAHNAADVRLSRYYTNDPRPFF